MEKLNGWGQVADFTFQNSRQRGPYTGIILLHLTRARFLQQTKIDLRSLHGLLPSLAFC